MALTDFEIRNAKEPKKMADGRGLYVLVRPNGSKLWRYDYRYAGKRRTLALGQYPAVKLADARRSLDAARRQLDKGVDPSEVRRQAKVAERVIGANTFGALAREKMERLRSGDLSEATLRRYHWLLFDCAASLKDRPVAKITPAEILSLLQGVERSGHREKAKRLRAALSAVFQLAIVTLRLEHDPMLPLRGALLPVRTTPRAALTEEPAFGRLLAAIERHDGGSPLHGALQFLALTFARPGEVQLAKWREIEGDVWCIPAERTKMRRPHEVPLSRQALAILDGMRPFAGDDGFIFPGRNPQRPLGHDALNVALRRMDYNRRQHTAHGFRASASSILNGRGYRHDVIEAQLAHVEQNQVRRVYNRAQYWPERVALMQDWADLCEVLRMQNRDHSDLI